MDYLLKLEKLENTCVTFGMFDGMHKGHMTVAKTVAEESKKRSLNSVILSFDGTRDKIVDQTNILTTEEEKVYYLKKMGIDKFISYSYTEEIQKMEADIFIKTILSDALGAKVVVVGRDCRFGKEGKGNLELLEKEAPKYGMHIVVCETVLAGGQPITSDSVKTAFKACDFEKMIELCGHPYTMIGEVMHGKALGRTVGMPTANLGVPDCKLKPPSGVYATLTDIEGDTYKGLTNIGKRPSVDDGDYITIETFLLDFAKDIYGKKIIMEVYLYIRGVVKFDCLEEVQKQVQKDLDKTKNYLEQIVQNN